MIKRYIIATTIAFFIAGCTTVISEKKETELSNGTEYTCKNGKKLNVVYFTAGEYLHRAQIEFEGTKYDLESVPSASGAKYSDGKYTWWTKGTSGFFEIGNDTILKSCVSQ